MFGYQDVVMNSQSLIGRSGLDEKAALHGPGEWTAPPYREQPARAKSNPDATEHSAGWQRHVMVLLWITIAVLIVAGIAAVVGHALGIFTSPGDHTPPPPPWPEGS
jgi:hypothetical protein